MLSPIRDSLFIDIDIHVTAFIINFLPVTPKVKHTCFVIEDMPKDPILGSVFANIVSNSHHSWTLIHFLSNVALHLFIIQFHILSSTFTSRNSHEAMDRTRGNKLNIHHYLIGLNEGLLNVLHLIHTGSPSQQMSFHQCHAIIWVLEWPEMFFLSLIPKPT